MNIYQVKDDYDHYQKILPLPEVELFDNNRVKEYKRWRVPKWKNYPPTAKADKKGQKANNDASCWYGGCLIMKKPIAEKMLAELNINAQLLKIDVINREEEFVFVNVLTALPVVNEEGLTISESIDAMMENRMKFHLAPIGNEVLFRDRVHLSTYYCTGEFKDWIEKNGVTGLALIKKGEAV